MSDSNEKRLNAARWLIGQLAGAFDSNLSIRLWDGSSLPVGDSSRQHGANNGWVVSVSGPGPLAAIARRPTLETVLREYVAGRIDVCGGDLIDFVGALSRGGLHVAARNLRPLSRLRRAWPLIIAPADPPVIHHTYGGSEAETADPGENGASAPKDRDFIQFHYDVGNEFYEIFLDEALVYSCAYFTDWSNSLDQAQQDKIEMICRKLRLEPGDRLLDIGCGWGALIRHAARHYDVIAHGVTLSEAQYTYAREKIAADGLSNRCTVECADYASVDGTWDKIASIGMYEHVRVANYPKYFSKLHDLLRDRGILLNHGITRVACRSEREFREIGEGNRLILKYIFPGSELDHIGHTLDAMEVHGFETHDVEGWREHYARTTRLWCERLLANRETAVDLVGAERYRMWIAYLAGVSAAFADGRLQIFQTIATKRGSRHASGMPPTREDLYRI